MRLYDSEYGLWRIAFVNHAYRGILVDKISISVLFEPSGVRPKEEDFPKPLAPVFDLPPAKVITRATPTADGRLRVSGVAQSNTVIKQVLVNGRPAESLRDSFVEWEAVVDAADEVTAEAQDSSGNTEQTPHILRIG